MSLLDEINAAQVIDNPNTEMKDSKYVDPGTSLLNDLSKASLVNENQINLTSVINPTDYQSQYDIGLTPMIDNVEAFRASKQGWASQLGNALAGGVGSGLVGAIEGFSNIADQLLNVGNATEEWERSTLSTVLNDLKTDINELTPLYRKDREDVFDWNDSGFYFEVLKGAVDSAVAFGLPGAGYGLAVGKLGSILGKADLLGRRLDVLTRAGGRALGISNPAQKLGAGTAALLSNYNEGTVMGMQVYDEKKQEFIDTLTQDLVNKRMQAGEDTSISDSEFKQIELEASMEAGKAAETVRDFNHFMVASNYISVKSLFNGAKSTAARSMVKKPTLKNWAKDQLVGAPMEGMEEIAQGILQSEVGFRAQDNIYNRNNVDTSAIEGLEEYRKLKGMEFGDRLLDFATKDETLLEGMMGLISGPIQYAVTSGPGAKKALQSQQIRYNQQQGIVGRNETFIKDKLTYEQTKEELIGSFDDYRKNILGKDEFTEEDTQAYQALIEDTSFDTLAVENFFGGTTENLEKQLQDVEQDQNATPEEKAAAQKHLSRLNELEQRFNQYSMYQDGAHMFATKVRSERLDSIKKVLDTAYPQMEAGLTQIVNSKLEANAKRNKEKKLKRLEDVLYYVDEVETIDDKGKKKLEKTRVPVRSVTEAVDAYIENKELKSSYGSIHNEFKDGKAFDIATKNRMMKAKIDAQLSFYNRILDESKSLEYENEYAEYADAREVQDSKEKVSALKEVKTNLDKKYPETKYLNLKTRIQNEISFLEKAITDAEQTQAQTQSQQASTQSTEAKAQKVKEKTQGKVTTPEVTTDPDTGQSIVSTPSSQDPDSFPDIDIPEGNQSPLMAKLEAEAKAKTTATPEVKVNTPLDQAAKATPPVAPAVSTPVVEQTSPAQLLTDEEAQASLENFEPKPTANTSVETQRNITTVLDQNKAKVEGTSKDDGTRAKLMTTGGTVEFESKVLKNMRDKTGVEVDLRVSSTLPQGMYGKGEALARRAIETFNAAKKKYTETKKWNPEEFEFMVKYLPISVDFGGGAISYLYPMNWENDSTQNPGKKNAYTDQQNKGEYDLRKKAITAALKGQQIKVKVKGQLPGALNFGAEEKMLSEMNGFLENPMAVKMFVSIDGSLQPAVKGDTYNPFFGTTMTYNTKTGKEPWTGIFVIEVKAVNGMSFPLKVNTKNHNQGSAEILYTLFQKMISPVKGNKNIMSVSVQANDVALYEQIITLLPNLVNTYGKDFTYAQVINDMVFEGPKTKGRASELFFEKGKINFGGNSFNNTDFNKAEVKAQFTQFIQDFKTFNVNVAKLNDPDYRKHVFSSYLSTNAQIDDMFTADGTLNPSGDSVQRMKSGAMYLDVTSARLVEPVQDTQADQKKALMMNAETIADALADATAGNIVIDKGDNLMGEDAPKTDVEKMVEAEKKATEEAKEIDRCNLKGSKKVDLAAAKKAAKDKLGPIDL